MDQTNNLGFKIDTAHPHTIKKFELIDKYVSEWAVKLLKYNQGDGIVFIDCMSNCGYYNDVEGNNVYGTPVRVAKTLSALKGIAPNKNIALYFNDDSQEKIEYLAGLLPKSRKGFEIHLSSMDANAFLKNMHSGLSRRLNYLLVYDPYLAAIDWEALTPFFNIWGEVIINHMVHDVNRGVSQAKNSSVVSRYETTYQKPIEELRYFSGDINEFEDTIQGIIIDSRSQTKKDYYISSFPFFTRSNQLMYNLIHCSSNLIGCQLFKKTAWNTFGGKSSSIDTKGRENQLMLDFENEGELTTITDERCYHVQDIAKYIQGHFKGKKDVPLKIVYSILDDHPIFPSEGYRSQIKTILKEQYGVHISKNTMSF